MNCKYEKTCSSSDNCEGPILTISHAKPLIPNKEWIVENNGQKLGTLSKEKKGYVFLSKGVKVQFDTLQQVETEMELVLDAPVQKIINKNKEVYGYETKTVPYNPIYDVKRKLPIYTKSSKSTSKHCAGHYIIKFPKGWVKSHCPKLITLERYPFKGPFYTEQESRDALTKAHRERNQ